MPGCVAAPHDALRGIAHPMLLGRARATRCLRVCFFKPLSLADVPLRLPNRRCAPAATGTSQVLGAIVQRATKQPLADCARTAHSSSRKSAHARKPTR
jgi:hypothetical protein